MGRLRYGSDVYELPDTDVVALQFALWSAFDGEEDAERRALFFIEMRSEERTVTLTITRGVPIAFEVDTSDPMHDGSRTVDEFIAMAKSHGVIELWAGDPDADL